MQLPLVQPAPIVVDSYEATFAKIRLWAGVGLFVLLGIMLGTAVLNL